MKLGVIKPLARQHSVRQLCRTLGVARSACYAAAKKPARPRARDNARRGEQRGARLEASGRTDGSPRLTVALRRAGQRGGRRRVARLMRRAGLRAKQKRRFRPRTTDRRHLCPIAPHRLAERAESPARPGEGWQADITSVATKEGRLSVAGVLAACSRKIVGWAADDTMPAALVARACERAVQAQRPLPGLLHPSDRASQYASDACRQLLRSHGVVPSRSRAGNCDRPRQDGELLGDAEDRTHRWAGVRHARPSKERALLLHRGLLQPHAAPRRARFLLPRGL